MKKQKELIVHEAVKPMARGQITLPKKLRELLNIDEDTWLWIDYDGDDIKLYKIEDEEEIELENKWLRLKEFVENNVDYDGDELWTEEDDEFYKEMKEKSKEDFEKDMEENSW